MTVTVGEDDTKLPAQTQTANNAAKKRQVCVSAEAIAHPTSDGPLSEPALFKAGG